MRNQPRRDAVKTVREGVEKPGDINVVTATGYHNGCNVQYFRDPKELVEWAGENPIMLLVQLVSDAKLGGMWGFYTKALTPDEEEAADMFSREVQEKVDEMMTRKQEAQAKLKAEQEAETKQMALDAEQWREYKKRIGAIKETTVNKKERAKAEKELAKELMAKEAKKNEAVN